MSISFASIKAVLAHVFGIGEDKAHSLVEAVIADTAPVFNQLRTDIVADVAKLSAEAKADAGALYAEALSDVRTELAAIKALIGQQAPPVADPTPAAPATVDPTPTA